MGTLAAIAGAIGRLISFIQYLFQRKDDPVVAARHLDEQTKDDKKEFDNAIVAENPEDLNRLFGELDDKSDSLLTEGGSDTGRQGDSPTP